MKCRPACLVLSNGPASNRPDRRLNDLAVGRSRRGRITPIEATNTAADGPLAMVALMAIDWTRDEIVLACALVRDHGWQGVRADQQEVRDLSALLQQAPLHAVEIRDAAFRSPNSVQRTWPTPLVTKAVLVGDCAGRPSLRSATSPRAPAEAHTDWSYLTSYPNTGHDRHLVRRPPGVGSGAGTAPLHARRPHTRKPFRLCRASSQAVRSCVSVQLRGVTRKSLSRHPAPLARRRHAEYLRTRRIQGQSKAVPRRIGKQPMKSRAGQHLERRFAGRAPQRQTDCPVVPRE